MGGDLAPPTMVATQVRDERRQEKEEREKQPFDFYRRPSFVGGLNQTPSSFSGRKTAEAALALPLILISRACTRSRLHCLNGEWKHAKPAKRERESTETFFFFFFFLFSMSFFREKGVTFFSLSTSTCLLKKKKNSFSQEELHSARVDLASRDFCAHLLVPLNECRRKSLYMPWSCGAQRHAYEKCEYFDYKRRVAAKEKENEEKKK